MKCPVWLAFLAAWSSRLSTHGEHAWETNRSDGETRSAPEVHVLFRLVSIVVMLSGAERSPTNYFLSDFRSSLTLNI